MTPKSLAYRDTKPCPVCEGTMRKDCEASNFQRKQYTCQKCGHVIKIERPIFCRR